MSESQQHVRKSAAWQQISSTASLCASLAASSSSSLDASSWDQVSARYVQAQSAVSRQPYQKLFCTTCRICISKLAASRHCSLQALLHVIRRSAYCCMMCISSMSSDVCLPACRAHACCGPDNACHKVNQGYCLNLGTALQWFHMYMLETVTCDTHPLLIASVPCRASQCCA